MRMFILGCNDDVLFGYIWNKQSSPVFMHVSLHVFWQDGEVLLYEKKTGHQELLWNPTPDVRAQRLKRQVVKLDQQGPFESERYMFSLQGAFVVSDDLPSALYAQ